MVELTMDKAYKDDIASADRKKDELKKALREITEKAAKRRPAELVRRIHEIHNEVFAEIDCLNCANCCKVIGPKLVEPDIVRLAKMEHLTRDAWANNRVRVGENNDKTINELPCPYLGDDHYCAVYDSRPRSCREYPHTANKDIHHRLHRLVVDSLYCPAAYRIAVKIVEEFH